MIPVRAYFRLFAQYLRPYRARAFLLALVLFGTIALQLANPLFQPFDVPGQLIGATARFRWRRLPSLPT